MDYYLLNSAPIRSRSLSHPGRSVYSFRSKFYNHRSGEITKVSSTSCLSAVFKSSCWTDCFYRLVLRNCFCNWIKKQTRVVAISQMSKRVNVEVTAGRVHFLRFKTPFQSQHFIRSLACVLLWYCVVLAPYFYVNVTFAAIKSS